MLASIFRVICMALLWFVIPAVSWPLARLQIIKLLAIKPELLLVAVVVD
jgi:hypothetical protein